MLYILGYGRSGSTMLGMALGKHPAMVNLGEISLLRDIRARPDLRLTALSRGVARRLESMKILAQINGSLSPKLEWRRYTPWLPEPRDELPRWSEATAALYRAMIEEANATIAVDASKGGSSRVVAMEVRRGRSPACVAHPPPEVVLRSQTKHGRSVVRTTLSWQLAQRQAARLVRQVESAGVRPPAGQL